MHSHALGAIVVFLGRSKKWGSTGHVAADGKGPKGELFFSPEARKISKNWAKSVTGSDFEKAVWEMFI